MHALFRTLAVAAVMAAPMVLGGCGGARAQGGYGYYGYRDDGAPAYGSGYDRYDGAPRYYRSAPDDEDVADAWRRQEWAEQERAEQRAWRDSRQRPDCDHQDDDEDDD